MLLSLSVRASQCLSENLPSGQHALGVGQVKRRVCDCNHPRSFYDDSKNIRFVILSVGQATFCFNTNSVVGIVRFLSLLCLLALSSFSSRRVRIGLQRRGNSHWPRPVPIVESMNQVVATCAIGSSKRLSMARQIWCSAHVAYYESTLDCSAFRICDQMGGLIA